jgi:hypothetical protein
VVDRKEDLEPALRRLAEPDGTLPVLEAFVPGRSLSASLVLRNRRVVALAARETLTFDPIGGGTSVWKRTVPLSDTGVQEAVELLRSLGYEGLAEVEYQVPQDGAPRLMEIGVRVHGWVPLALAAGVDLALIGARSLLGDEIRDTTLGREGVEMRWPAGELARIREAFLGDTPLPPGTTRSDIVRGLWPPWRPGMRYDGIELSDLSPWLPAPVRRRAERRLQRRAGR